jgi:hypothetical protein
MDQMRGLVALARDHVAQVTFERRHLVDNRS